MTGPESRGAGEFASLEDLADLYRVAAFNTIRYGEIYDPKLDTIVANSLRPYPHGAHFEVHRSGLDIAEHGGQTLRDMAQRWSLDSITFQFLSEYEAQRFSFLPPELTPATLGILIKRTDGVEDVFIIENRLVDGVLTPVTDRMDNLAPGDEMRDHDLRFTAEETADLLYMAGHVPRLPSTGPIE